ncbi:LysM peptidoglycan-binding domain-containing protein, partial [Methylobacterium haplocladii]
PGAGQALPANPPGAPPRLAGRSPTAPQGPDMAASGAPGDQPATVFVPEIDTAKITRGDNLWQISRRSYGDGKRYTVIYDANRDQIRDPNLIYPGQIFVMPKESPAADRQGAKRG